MEIKVNTTSFIVYAPFFGLQLLKLFKVVDNTYGRTGLVLWQFSPYNFQGLLYQARGIGYAVEDKDSVFDSGMEKIDFNFIVKDEFVYNSLGP